MSAARIALYYAPAADSLLAEFGRRWFGRDETTGAAVPRLSLPHIGQTRLAELTRAAAVYGFHATLRSPIRLAAGADGAAIHAAAAVIAARHTALPLDRLELVARDDFVGLMLPEDPPALQALHLDCLESLEPYRLQDPRADAARAARHRLTPSMAANLSRWGYPYVADDFRFHLTLTAAPADAAETAALARDLGPLLAPARAGLMLDAIAVFEQPAPGADFLCTGRYPLVAP